jgi:hypothetical protein
MQGVQFLSALLKETARSPLGTVALVIIAVAVVGFFLFRNAPVLTRFVVFLLLFVGTALFGIAVVNRQKTLVHEVREQLGVEKELSNELDRKVSRLRRMAFHLETTVQPREGTQIFGERIGEAGIGLGLCLTQGVQRLLDETCQGFVYASASQTGECVQAEVPEDRYERRSSKDTMLVLIE